MSVSLPLLTFIARHRLDGVTPFADLPVAPLDREWEWNAMKAQAVLGDPDDPDWERFRRAHLWVDTDAIRERGEPTRGDFKFPIAEMIGERLTAVWRAMAAARGRLGQSEISAADKIGIAKHIDRYVRKINEALPEDETPKELSEDQETEVEITEEVEVVLSPEGDFPPGHRTGEGDLDRDSFDKPRMDAGDFVHRYDRGEFLPSPVLRADGSLLISGIAARPGVLVYQNNDGTVTRELVLASELRRTDSLATLGRAPVTLEHPDQEVSPTNVQQFGVGDVDGDITIVEGGFVTVKMAVRRADAISAINAGKQELSPGYRVRIELTSGEHPVFGRFDAIQRDRQYNHLAVVDSARGGPSVRLRTDSAAYQVRDSSTPPEPTMKLLAQLLAALGVTKSDSDDADITKAIAAVDKFKADAAGAKAAVEKAKADADTKVATAEQAKADADAKVVEAEKAKTDAEVERDTEKGKADALQAKVDTAEAAEVARADAETRKDLDATRESFKLDAVKDEDNATLQRRLAEHVATDLGIEIKTDASPDYLASMIATGAAGIKKRVDARDPYRGLAQDDPDKAKRQDGAGDDNRPKSTNDIYKKHADAALATGRGGDK